MRERLIGLLSKFEITCSNTCSGLEKSCHSCRLGQLADFLLADGWMRPPCKVGDEVYFNTYENNGSTCIGIKPHKVTAYRLGMVVGNEIGKPITVLPEYEFGKTVFLTKEEAEAAFRKEDEGK